MGKRARTADTEDDDDEFAQIAHGSFGTVHALSASRVVKKCSFQARREDVNVPFLREFTNLKTLGNSHYNVVRAFDFNIKQRSFSMERLSGSLFQFLHKQGAKSEAATLDATLQIARGVAFLHDCGIVHRDLSSNNILVDLQPHDPRFVICDFGSAVRATPGRKMTTMVTTLPFRAPEVLFGSEFFSTPVDVWAIGVLAIEIGLGRSFIHRETNDAQLTRIFFLKGAPSATNWPDAPNLPDFKIYEPCLRLKLALKSVELEAAMLWAMTLDPSRRPTAAAVVSRLEACRGGVATVATTPQTKAFQQKKPNGFGWTVCEKKDTFINKNGGLSSHYHRAKAIDYIVANASDLRVSRLSLHNAVYLLDEYISLKSGKIAKEKIQSIALGSLMVASKLFDVHDVYAKDVAADTGTTIDELVELEVEIMELAVGTNFGFGTTILSEMGDLGLNSSIALQYMVDFSLLVPPTPETDFKKLANAVKKIAAGDTTIDVDCDCYEEHAEMLRLLGTKPMNLLEVDGMFADGRSVIKF